MPRAEKRWGTYEEVAAHLLNQMAEEFGLERVEGKQVLRGKDSATDWEIDAKGICRDREAFVLIECRRFMTSRQDQAKIAALAYSIRDTGASGGIIVSPLGLQRGAQLVAAAENIVSVRLEPNSTTRDYTLWFLGRVVKGMSGQITPSGSLTMTVFRKDGSVEEGSA